MGEYFKELMNMWDKTTEEHVAWLEKSKQLSIIELMEDILRLSSEVDGFSERTKHMKSENVGSEATILAAKFKNQYATSRFLVSVLIC